jgi:hypothetical protein
MHAILRIKNQPALMELTSASPSVATIAAQVICALPGYHRDLS